MLANKAFPYSCDACYCSVAQTHRTNIYRVREGSAGWQGPDRGSVHPQMDGSLSHTLSHSRLQRGQANHRGWQWELRSSHIGHVTCQTSGSQIQCLGRKGLLWSVVFVQSISRPLTFFNTCVHTLNGSRLIG